MSKHGLSLRRIAAEVGCAVNTVRRHLALEAVPKYERKIKRSGKLAPHEAYLRERPTAARPNWIPAGVLHREIIELGYQSGLSQLCAFMRSLRPTLPVERIAEVAPAQHPLAVYEQLLMHIQQGVAA